jgi:hypothetical protein
LRVTSRGLGDVYKRQPLFDEFGNKSAETKTMVGRILAAR